jgi:hypothetical protein
VLAESIYLDIGIFKNRPLPVPTQDTGSTPSRGWESLERLNTTQPCDPHSFIALYDFRCDDDDYLSIKANEEVGGFEPGTNPLDMTTNIQKMFEAVSVMPTHMLRPTHIASSNLQNQN